MGLSTIAAYGVLFTASIFMMGVLLNSLIYSYNEAQDGLRNRVDIINHQKNIISISRIVYNSTRMEIYAENEGPNTIDLSKVSIMVNGTLQTFNASGNYWYPGEFKKFFLNTSYEIGDNNNIQFMIGMNEIATSEQDKIYVLNSNGIYAYTYEGSLSWYSPVRDGVDCSVSSMVFVLNSTNIIEYALNGTQIGVISANKNFVAIDANYNYLYAVNRSAFVIYTFSGNIIATQPLVDGKDVAVGKNVYVLDGNTIKVFNYTGSYLSQITSSHITNATKISSDFENSEDYVVLLNEGNQLIIFKNGNYEREITLEEKMVNLDLYGKIYVSGNEVWAMNAGYRVKMVDDYGNEIYGFL